MTTSGEIKEVQEFCYLGVVVDCKAGVERAVRARVAAAWNKWREMVILLKNRHIPLKIRGSVYESCVRSVMLYGAETWQMTKKIEDILKHCDRKMMRYMAGVRWTDRISSVEVAWRCGLTDIQGKIRQRRLQWFGHVRREKDGGGLRRVEEIEFWEICQREDQNEHGGRQWSQTWKSWVLVRSLPWTEQAGEGSSQSPTPYEKGKADYKRI